ncbi:MAG: HEPN/Toprim-associated domain-containing protein [Chloroflexi bacterium]|nr:HEPN/Toprim-associated domain-containing protein [Chloroflexota bacterium]
MGEYTSLYISGYDVLSTKTYPVPEVMTIFRERDKRVYERKILERLKLEFRGHKETPLEEWEEANDIETAYEYSNTVSVIKQRLDILGFSFNKVKKEFEEVKEYRCIELEEEIALFRTTKEDKVSSELLARKRFELDALSNYFLDDWLKAYREILTRGLESSYRADEKHSSEHPLIRYILDYTDGKIANSFPCNDIRVFLRAFVEIAPDTALVIQDFTRVVKARYFEPEDPICQMMLDYLIGDYPINEKTIVLTEGSTDKEFIEKSLKLLYPHLQDYYAFMDFGGSNAPGGASSLVTTIKSFIGSGIRNRVIALFDNDTAAHVAIKSLRATKIPENIRILNYPYLEFATRYPTLGPSGTNENDINKLAVSIELFFGSDLLKDEKGEFIPIQWKGYDSSLNQYQGEILRKNELQQLFRNKLLMCMQDPENTEKTDWYPIKHLLTSIFEAFA